MTKRKIITAVIAVILILAAGAYKLYLQGEEAKYLPELLKLQKPMWLRGWAAICVNVP